jgi:hypothetical protein
MLRRLNILVENKAKLRISAEEIPTLIPQNILREWQANDNDPYYKLQAIKYPIKANGLNYKESFFEEYISKLKDRPIPGSKNGHDMGWGKRPSTDLLLVGALMEKKGDESGVVYLKNYIPKEGANGSNEIFIRECKSDMINFSIVAYTRDEVINDGDKMERNIVGSVKGERNDAVEYGLGAMEQKTNEDEDDENNIKYNPYPNEHAARVRDPGAFEKNSFRRKKLDTGIIIIIGHLKGETTTTTQSYRFDADVFTAAEAKAWLKEHKIKYILFEKATGKENIAVGDEDILNHGGVIMDKDELLKRLNALKENGDITLAEIAKTLGLENMVITERHTNAITILEAFEKLEIKDPVAEFNALKKSVEDNATAIFDARMTKEFGAEKLQNGSDNLIRQYAAGQLKNIQAEKLDEAIKNIKEDPIAKRLAADIADYSSDANEIARVEQKNKQPASKGRKVDKL